MFQRAVKLNINFNEREISHMQRNSVIISFHLKVNNREVMTIEFNSKMITTLQSKFYSADERIVESVFACFKPNVKRVISFLKLEASFQLTTN